MVLFSLKAFKTIGALIICSFVFHTKNTLILANDSNEFAFNNEVDCTLVFLKVQEMLAYTFSNIVFVVLIDVFFSIKQMQIAMVRFYLTYNAVSRLIGSNISIDTAFAQQAHFICSRIIINRQRERENFSCKCYFLTAILDCLKCIKCAI